MGLMGMVALIGALAMGTMEPVHVPGIVGLLLVLGGATWWVRIKHRYILAGCTSSEDMIRGEIARASLSWVILVAGVAGLSNRPLAWRRTPKFADQASEESPFTSTMPETVAGTVFAVLALIMLTLSDVLGAGIALLSFLSLAILALRFFCAPIMAAMAIRRTDPSKTPARRRLPLPREVTTNNVVVELQRELLREQRALHSGTSAIH